MGCHPEILCELLYTWTLSWLSVVGLDGDECVMPVEYGASHLVVGFRVTENLSYDFKLLPL